jgi:hypothetical protein
MYAGTYFKNAYDNKTNNRFAWKDWNEFEQTLYKMATVKLTKKEAPLFSPAVYYEGTTRSNKNTICWGKWAAVDVDECQISGNADDLKAWLSDFCGQYHYLCYSTASCRKEKLKFRLVFPITENLKADRIRHFWFALNEELGAIGDKQTKDPSRMFYIPAAYEGALNFMFTNEGETIEPDELMAKHEYNVKTGGSFLERLPDELQKAVITKRKEQATNTRYTWTGYRDCPFFPKKMAEDYKTMVGTGWYHKMYQIMVAVACNAVKKNYPITVDQIVAVCKELDMENGNWYERRPMHVEANSAIEYAYTNAHRYT